MAHTRDIFLDHAATTPLHPEALGLMLPYFGNHFGTPSMPFGFGDKPRDALDQARSRVARLIGASENEIIFTSSGTEANNLAILGISAAQKGKRHIITSAIEHISVLNTLRHLKEKGFEVTELGVDVHGTIDPASVESAIRDDTFLISIMHACSETGAIQNIEAIGRVADSRGIALHSDFIQSAGKVPINVLAMNITMLSISSHKVYGPKGSGALYVKEGTVVSPVFFGSDQEKGQRPGTINMPGIIGFGLACEKALFDMEKNARHIAYLRDTLEQTLMDRVPDIRINGTEKPRLPHISSISFAGIQADALAAWLDLYGITVSARAFFFSKRPSHALTALHIPPELAFGTIRFSPGWENSQEEILRTVETTANAVSGMRALAPYLEGDEACIVTFGAKKQVLPALGFMEKQGIPCAVSVRPVELEHLAGPQAVIAIPCNRGDETGSLLGSKGIGITGMHRIKGLCSSRSKKEIRFWETVSQIKKD
jgi:cysteine desulfurase